MGSGRLESNFTKKQDSTEQVITKSRIVSSPSDAVRKQKHLF